MLINKQLNKETEMEIKQRVRKIVVEQLGGDSLVSFVKGIVQ